jgi:hypothetical protein
MTRDPARFPHDDNGDVLWRMAQHGDQLEKPRQFDFAVIFPTEQDALGFAVHLLKQGQKVSFSEYEEGEDMPWQVEVHPFFVPTHLSITQYEALLAADAANFNGRNDGWGCMQQD